MARVDNRADHLGVRKAGRLGGHGKFLPAREPRIRIRFDHVDIAVGSEPHVDASIVAELERAVRGQGRVRQFLHCLFVEIFRDVGLGQLVDLGIFLEFHIVAGDLRCALGQARQIQFDQRQNLGAFVAAQNPGVDLAAFNVFLDQSGRIKFILDVLDAFHHFFDVLHDGARIDADRSVFPRRFHNQREGNVMGVLDASPVRRCEKRSLDSLKSEDLLGDGFILRQKNRVRPGARKAQAEQVQVSDHVHLFGVVAIERLRQIEDQIGVALGESMQRLRAAIQFEIRRLVPQLLQGLKDFLAVRLLFLHLLGFLVRLGGGSGLFLGCRSDGIFVPHVVQQRDFQFCSNHRISITRLSALGFRLWPAAPAANPKAESRKPVFLRLYKLSFRHVRHYERGGIGSEFSHMLGARAFCRRANPVHRRVSRSCRSTS